MFRNVVAALNESLDITMHLRPLAGHYEVQDKCYKWYIFSIQALEAADFADVRPLFAPLMHTVREEEMISELQPRIADVFGLQQLRVLQHN